jgi:outer membrane protein assembly factor BamB
MYALSMRTGEVLWSRKFTEHLDTDISGVGVRLGVIVTESEGYQGGGAAAVCGLNATTGEELWKFQTEGILWNFMPMFTDNDTFVFQDRAGGSYHHRLSDGARIWKAGYAPKQDDFTDGMTMLADGVVYTTHSDGTCCQADQSATLRAYDLSSGRQLWNQDFGHPINSQPAVGHLGKGAGLSERLAVVMPVGAQPALRPATYRSSIAVFDAKTGAPIWEYTFPDYVGALVAGDGERLQHGTMCLPNPYGSPTIDARGTIYTGHFNGFIYGIRDDNGDNIIQDSEVIRFNTHAGFSHGGIAIAPGMLAIPSCDGLYVFKEYE